MTSFYVTDFMKVVIAFFLAISQSSIRPASAHMAMLNPGDEIDGMTLTSGAADALPLWAFCTSEVEKNVTTAYCRVPQISKLAIGYVFPGMDEAFVETEWAELGWELYLDDKYIDLRDFGTYDYLLPAMAPHPSPVRKVFMTFTAWDVVLANLQPGDHTLEGRIIAGAHEYRWFANLVIEEASMGNEQKSGDIQLECPRAGSGLSRLHGSCRLIG